MSTAVSDRAEGTLLGLVCGHTLATGGRIDPDLWMACCLAGSLAALGRFDVEDVSRRYRALPERAAAGRSLARAAPIGVFFRGAREGEARRRAAIDDAAIGDDDPEARLAWAALSGAIAAAIAADRPDAAYVISAARADLDEAARLLAGDRPEDRDVISAARRSIEDDLAAARRDDPELHARGDLEGAGRTLRLAFWELAHAPSWEAGVVDAVRRGAGDEAGAIAGALLGARWGRTAIPADQVARVLGAPPDPRLGPLAEACHPRVLLDMIR